MYPLLTPAHPTSWSPGRNKSKEVVPNVTSKRHVRHAQHQTKCHPERREGSAFHASAPKTAPHPARTTPAANPPFVSARPPPCRNIAKERAGLEGSELGDCASSALFAHFRDATATPNIYKIRVPTSAPTTPPPHIFAAKDTPGTSDRQNPFAARPKYSRTHPAR